VTEADKYVIIEGDDCFFSTRADGVGRFSFVFGIDALYLCCLFLFERDQGLAEMMGEHVKIGKQESASYKFELSVSSFESFPDEIHRGKHDPHSPRREQKPHPINVFEIVWPKEFDWNCIPSPFSLPF
jgi:hypothetical protein